MAEISAKIRRLVRERADARCEYCRCPESFSSAPFSIDHIKPRALGGSDASGNLAFSCLGCNLRKQDTTQAIDPVNGQVVSLYDPRSQAWGNHFDWSADGFRVVGLTPTGRGTVERLALNRSGVQALRQALTALDLHPPLRLEPESP